MKTTASKMGILVRKTIVLALMLVVGAHMAPENIQSAGAQDAEASEGPYSDRSP